jgi:hypothetical protein
MPWISLPAASLLQFAPPCDEFMRSCGDTPSGEIGRLVKCGGEGACPAEANGKSDQIIG